MKNIIIPTEQEIEEAARILCIANDLDPDQCETLVQCEGDSLVLKQKEVFAWERYTSTARSYLILSKNIEPTDNETER